MKKRESESGADRKLEQLDTGFESLYDKVKEELESNRDIHKEQIRQMQELIRALTELNMQIQATEARNKEKATAKFAYIRQQAKEIRSSQKIVKEYYNNMMHKAYNEPHFWIIKNRENKRPHR